MDEEEKPETTGTAAGKMQRLYMGNIHGDGSVLQHAEVCEGHFFVECKNAILISVPIWAGILWLIFR